MAVYTNITLDELNEFLQLYSLGTVDELIGIKSGIENTNYLVSCGYYYILDNQSF